MRVWKQENRETCEDSRTAEIAILRTIEFVFRPTFTLKSAVQFCASCRDWRFFARQ